jgi:hypothetical protein
LKNWKDIETSWPFSIESIETKGDLILKILNQAPFWVWELWDEEFKSDGIFEIWSKVKTIFDPGTSDRKFPSMSHMDRW